MYLDNVLAKDEQIIKIAKLHWINNVTPWLFIIFGVLSIWLGIGLLLLIMGIYFLLRNKFTEMVVTNKRVIRKRGIVAVHTSEIRNIKIETVRLYQSILGRIFGYGDLMFTGTGTSCTIFERISDPAITKTMFEEVIDSNK